MRESYSKLTVAVSCLIVWLSNLLSADTPASLRIGRQVIQVGAQQVDAEMGTFSVPERYTTVGRRRIKLAFLRFKSTSPHPGTPILYLAGGPGTSGIDYVTSQRFEPYLQLRQFGDLITLNQRGTEHSEPSLLCPHDFEYPLSEEADAAKLTRAYRAFAISCAEYWTHRGVDLSTYNTEENAHDVKTLADALGIRKFILFGASYGSHLGLAVIRYHPDLVERAVLGGIEGPDQTIKLPFNGDAQLDAVSHLIASDSEVGMLLPNFRSLVEALTKQFSTHPVDVAIDSPDISKGQRRILRLSAIRYSDAGVWLNWEPKRYSLDSGNLHSRTSGRLFQNRINCGSRGSQSSSLCNGRRYGLRLQRVPRSMATHSRTA